METLANQRERERGEERGSEKKRECKNNIHQCSYVYSIALVVLLGFRYVLLASILSMLLDGQ